MTRHRTMNASLLTVAALLLLAVAPVQGLPAAVPQSLTVDARGTPSVAVLLAGSYVITAQGTYRFGPHPAQTANAEFDFEISECSDRGILLDLSINGADVAWSGPCRGSTLSTVYDCAAACQLVFKIEDVDHRDNSGSLTVSIAQQSAVSGYQSTTVPADGSVVSLALARGEWRLVASGTYRFGPGPTQVADAAYDYEGGACQDRGVLLDLVVDGGSPWGTCSPGLYSASYRCAQTTCVVRLWIVDIDHRDNSGSLRVDAAQVGA